mgnify:CR=1 FL=1
MATKAIQAIRGMKDLLPEETVQWQQIEAALLRLMRQYGYDEIRMPILEKTELFKRSIGEVTDIVEKEMYTFDDRNGDSLTLRPEGTAACVRAALEHGLLYNQTQRLWYYGPMFRHERPQKGRYRQFHQFGVESFGIPSPDVEAEHILLMARFWQAFGIEKDIKLHINSLGTSVCRQKHRDALVSYLSAYQDQLDEDCKRRLTTNPLRILDSKNPDMKAIVEGAPKLSDYLSDEARAHYDAFKGYLDKAGQAYVENPNLVRGLDYYAHTVYEWVTEALGAQGTVCAGGRYDDLVSQLGGQATPGVGFAMGIERVAELIANQKAFKACSVDAYLILMGDKALATGVVLAEKIREGCPALNLLTHCGQGSAKSQFKKADKSGARWALVIGDDEVDNNQVTLKYLQEEKPQETISLDALNQYLKKKGD